MKYLPYFVLICILLSNCTKKVSNLTIKDDKTVEKIYIGMPIDEAVKIADKSFFVVKEKTQILDDNSNTYEYLVYINKNKKELLFSFNGGYESRNKDKVFRIVLKDARYSTTEGITVGMNIKELKANAKLKGADFNFEDGLYIFSGKFDGGYWIDIDPNKSYKEFNYDKPMINKIPEDLKIKGIIFF